MDILIYRVRKDEHATLSEVIKSNLHTDRTKFNIHVHRNGGMLDDIQRIYVTLSEVVNNNLQTDGTKFNIHVHRNVDILIYRVRKDEYSTLSEVFKITYKLMELSSTSMYIEMWTY